MFLAKDHLTPARARIKTKQFLPDIGEKAARALEQALRYIVVLTDLIDDTKVPRKSEFREAEYTLGWRQASVRGIIIYLARMLAMLEGRTMIIGSIVIRCHEFDRMLAFWQQALHYVPREPVDDGWVVLCDPGGRGPNMSLEKVPEPFEPIGKTSRVHLDLYTNDQQGEVERLVELGATRYPRTYSPGEDFIVLEDPDGNRFCVVQVTSENRTILPAARS